ncbi:MAG: Sec62 family protein translocation protein [Oscillospiraceae bacterium]|nr:Sec62 family protein translocation protein [Oscillospiraceae bacterium]
MKILTCPNCTAPFEVDGVENNIYTCKYCNTSVKIPAVPEVEGEVGPDDHDDNTIEITINDEVVLNGKAFEMAADKKAVKSTVGGCLGCLGSLVVLAAIFFALLWFVVPGWLLPTINVTVGETAEHRNVAFTLTHVEMGNDGRIAVHFTIENNRSGSFRVYGGDWNAYIDGVSAGRSSIQNMILGGAMLHDSVDIYVPDGWRQIRLHYTAENFRRFRFIITPADVSGAPDDEFGNIAPPEQPDGEFAVETDGGLLDTLVGTWDWDLLGTITRGYWVFNADGTASMGSVPGFAWLVDNGVLSVFPEGSPAAATTWNMLLSGDTLRLEHTTMPGVWFEYIRAN